MTYSRENPSEDSLMLSEQYRLLHNVEDSADSVYPGKSLYPHISTIKQLIDRAEAKTVLDYGAGKARQYTDVWIKKKGAGIVGTVPQYWEVDVMPWDPNYPANSSLPAGIYDGVISTDVLEHIPLQDMDWVLEEIFSRSSRFVFINVANYQAQTVLPNGMNAHVSVFPTEVWKDQVEKVARNFPNILYVFRVTHEKGGLFDDISNFEWTDKARSDIGVLPAGYMNVIGYYFNRLRKK